MLLIKNCYMIDPRSGREGNCNILMKDKKIRKIQLLQKESKEVQGDDAELLQEADGEPVQIIDAVGLVAAPALVDVHVHFRDPGFTYKEDIESGSRCGAAGGFGTVILMANTKPVNDNADTLGYVLEKAEGMPIHVKTCCAITKGFAGKELTDMSELLKKGAVGFTDDGIPLLDEAIVRAAMEKAKELGVVLSFHEENPAFIQNNGVNAGKAAAHFGIGGSDRKAEISMVERDLRLAKETGATIHIQHISTAEAVELVRQAKAEGVLVHAEATPHHFTLTEDAVIAYGTLAKMNPPLRTEQDRLAIIEGLKDGTIDVIATDHAPHSEEEKARPITEAPSGIIGLETALPLGITKLVKTGELTMGQLLERMAFAPAALYGLDCGYLEEGGPADVVLFDPEETYRISGFVSKASNSPFLGEELQGVVKYTICDGRIAYQNSGK